MSFGLFVFLNAKSLAEHGNNTHERAVLFTACLSTSFFWVKLDFRGDPRNNNNNNREWEDKNTTLQFLLCWKNYNFFFRAKFFCRKISKQPKALFVHCLKIAPGRLGKTMHKLRINTDRIIKHYRQGQKAETGRPNIHNIWLNT